MDGYGYVEKDFIVHMGMNWEPAEFLKNRCDVTDGRCSGSDAGGSVLDQLQFVDGFMRETIEMGVAGIKTGGNQHVDQDGGAVRSKRWKEVVNIATVDEDSTGNVGNVSLE